MEMLSRVAVRSNAWQDARGWGIKPFEAADIPARLAANLHIVSLKPGAVRGNHYHPEAVEWLLIFGGRAKLLWRSGEAGPIRSMVVEGSEPCLYVIAAGVAHAVVNVSATEIYLAAFNDQASPQTIPVPPLEAAKP